MSEIEYILDLEIFLKQPPSRRPRLILFVSNVYVGVKADDTTAIMHTDKIAPRIFIIMFL